MNKRFNLSLLSLLGFASFPFLLINSYVGAIIFTVLLLILLITVFMNVFSKKNRLNIKIKQIYSVKFDKADLFCLYVSILSSYIGYQQGDKIIVLIFLIFSFLFLLLIIIRADLHSKTRKIDQ